jgi:hypothetical protein
VNYDDKIIIRMKFICVKKKSYVMRTSLINSLLSDNVCLTVGLEWLKNQKNQLIWLNQENQKKKTEKIKLWKKTWLNQLKFWKNRPVRFYKPKTEKTEPNPNRKKQVKPEKKQCQNRAKPVWTVFYPKKSNQNRLVWTSFGFKIKLI